MKNIKVIKNAQIVLENGIIWDGIILIEDGIIREVGKKNEIIVPENTEAIDAGGCYVGPGFVDIHCHGCNDWPLYEECEKASEYFLSNGTTTILASPPYSIDFDGFMNAVKTVKKAVGKVKNLKGLYMEGPYTNPEYGAHSHSNPWRGPIDEKQYKKIVDEAGNLARVWTVAPEREGIVEFMKYAKAVNPNTVFALGHSKATPEQIRKTMSKNLRPKVMTHTFNATGRISGDSGGLRGYGPDEYCLAEHDMYAELISDSLGIHVHSDLQRMLMKTKGVERIVMITDCTFFDGETPEEYAHVTDLNFDDRGGIAGSRLTMNQACRNIMSHTNCGIAQVFVMASLNPAKVLGMDDEIGSIEIGKLADLVFVDDKFNVQRVMLNGEICKF